MTEVLAQLPAEAQPEPLRWTAYATAHTVRSIAEHDAVPPQHIEVLRGLDISRVFIEVYRGGVELEQAVLEQVRDRFIAEGFDVGGAIATVPGEGFGVRQEAPLGWFNWQNEKTQRDIERVMRRAAGVFDVFIVDDFLCTGDVSAESDAARDGRSWSEYRRDLLNRLSTDIFIEPARAVNPDITLVIKYPQWYDKFHLFGYDVPRKSALFDLTWVGTETRGARTQRYGFVQPYEGFVNFRWIQSIAGSKVQGAWFDHGDTDGLDFLEQAYQTVLAGAPEIVLFNYHNLMEGHEGHELLRRHQERLARLSAAVRTAPVWGVPAYKPPNSDAGGDLYLMDFIGMLGIPLVPVAAFPEDAPVVVLPAQAAQSPDIRAQIERAADRGTRLIVTTGFLEALDDGSGLAQAFGVRLSRQAAPPIVAREVVAGGMAHEVPHGLRLGAVLQADGAEVLLSAHAGDRDIPVLTRYSFQGAEGYVWNTFTFSQEDFDAVGEVLLAPAELGLLDAPRPWLNRLRTVFNGPLGVRMDAPGRVTLQPFGETSWFVHNYRLEPVTITLEVDGNWPGRLCDGFTGEGMDHEASRVTLTIPARDRRWIHAVDTPAR